MSIERFYYGIYLSNAQNTYIGQSTISDNQFGIFVVYGSYGIAIEQIKVNNNNCGVVLSGSGNTLSHSNLTDNNESGIQLWMCTQSSIFSNNLSNGGISIDFSFEGLDIDNNTLDNKPIYYAKNMDYRNNQTIIENVGQIILYNSYGFVIKNNTFNKAPIIIEKGGYNSIISNTIKNCYQYGIRLHQSSGNMIISNTITKNNGNGLWLFSSSDNTINSNTVEDNKDYGIFVDESNNTRIIDNAVKNNTFGIFGMFSNKNEIMSNVVTNNRDKGIYFERSANNSVAFNDIQDNKFYGLFILGDTGTDNNATNNWWGDATGPYNAKSNPNGKGDNITDGVPFSPWATSPFNIASQPTTSEPKKESKGFIPGFEIMVLLVAMGITLFRRSNICS